MSKRIRHKRKTANWKPGELFITNSSSEAETFTVYYLYPPNKLLYTVGDCGNLRTGKLQAFTGYENAGEQESILKKAKGTNKNHFPSARSFLSKAELLKRIKQNE